MTTTTSAVLPKVLEPFAGRILDADSHEYTPMNMWEEQFGPVVREFVEGRPTEDDGGVPGGVVART